MDSKAVLETLTQAPGTADRLTFLDSLLAMGEEPYEIDSYVREYAEGAAQDFALWTELRGLPLPGGFYASFVDCFMEYTYLERWQRGRSIARANKPFLADFINSFGDELAADVQSPANIYDTIALFFRFLEDRGYAVDLPRIQRAVTALRKEKARGREVIPPKEAVH